MAVLPLSGDTRDHDGELHAEPGGERDVGVVAIDHIEQRAEVTTSERHLVPSDVVDDGDDVRVQIRERGDRERRPLEIVAQRGHVVVPAIQVVGDREHRKHVVGVGATSRSRPFELVHRLAVAALHHERDAPEELAHAKPVAVVVGPVPDGSHDAIERPHTTLERRPRDEELQRSCRGMIDRDGRPDLGQAHERRDVDRRDRHPRPSDDRRQTDVVGPIRDGRPGRASGRPRRRRRS